MWWKHGRQGPSLLGKNWCHVRVMLNWPKVFLPVYINSVWHACPAEKHLLTFFLFPSHSQLTPHENLTLNFPSHMPRRKPSFLHLPLSLLLTTQRTLSPTHIPSYFFPFLPLSHLLPEISLAQFKRSLKTHLFGVWDRGAS